jgi:group I intron endonuclease
LSNQKLYIGQTKKTIEERFKNHLKLAKRHTNRCLYDAMNKYGYDNFIIKQIE